MFIAHISTCFVLIYMFRDCLRQDAAKWEEYLKTEKEVKEDIDLQNRNRFTVKKENTKKTERKRDQAKTKRK